jgi:lipoprotein signal peptidase
MKSLAVSKLPEMETFSYLGDTFRLQLTYNQGAFLGLGHSFPDGIKFIVFIVGIAFLLLGALFFALSSKPGTFPVVLAVSLFVAGGIGTLIDRIRLGGVVVDFLNVGIGSLRIRVYYGETARVSVKRRAGAGNGIFRWYWKGRPVYPVPHCPCTLIFFMQSSATSNLLLDLI